MTSHTIIIRDAHSKCAHYLFVYIFMWIARESSGGERERRILEREKPCTVLLLFKISLYCCCRSVAHTPFNAYSAQAPAARAPHWLTLSALNKCELRTKQALSLGCATWKTKIANKIAEHGCAPAPGWVLATRGCACFPLSGFQEWHCEAKINSLN